MEDFLVIGVPRVDGADLERLAAEVGLAGELSEQHYFDGEPWIELAKYSFFSAAGWHTLRTWLQLRAERLRHTRVTYKGVEIEGMGPKDTMKIIALLDEEHQKAQTKNTKKK
ncbi:hypothetical protein CH278_24610 [Rhodococcus sp. 05-2254-5]|uniref:hypothetical protein n=1 Tax=unclassified Rhodococcus (in: high G+C Gram-positive bacteria) TaxID=192944 RepID=UPI000B9A383E|nr:MULTISPECIES: hypothetical protein [unclassified Rhodococcus (in: high G+C Gram-positive bacteria)]OZE28107.1 hypothetical protein CH278_24610 [Rhodococcus sp. 05-2254-5]OZE52470.1 hypothetical protein CH269_23525 [Rhodococcus sp. 05-2254-1]